MRSNLFLVLGLLCLVGAFPAFWLSLQTETAAGIFHPLGVLAGCALTACACAARAEWLVGEGR